MKRKYCGPFGKANMVYENEMLGRGRQTAWTNVECLPGDHLENGANQARKCTCCFRNYEFLFLGFLVV